MPRCSSALASMAFRRRGEGGPPTPPPLPALPTLALLLGLGGPLPAGVPQALPAALPGGVAAGLSWMPAAMVNCAEMVLTRFHRFALQGSTPQSPFFAMHAPLAAGMDASPQRRHKRAAYGQCAPLLLRLVVKQTGKRTSQELGASARPWQLRRRASAALPARPVGDAVPGAPRQGVELQNATLLVNTLALH